MWRQAVLTDRTRGNRYKLESIKFQIDTKKIFSTIRVVNYWNRLPIKVAKSLSSERFKTSPRAT